MFVKSEKIVINNRVIGKSDFFSMCISKMVCALNSRYLKIKFSIVCTADLKLNNIHVSAYRRMMCGPFTAGHLNNFYWPGANF